MYAQHLHGRLERRGRLWQSRFYSCVLDDRHFFTALAYVDLNPVRAGLVDSADAYRWSSAAAHCALGDAPPWLDSSAFRPRYSAREWQDLLREPVSRAELAALRSTTQRGLPYGPESFLRDLEARHRVHLLPVPPRTSQSRPGSG